MTKPAIDIGRVGIWFAGIDGLRSPDARRAAQLVEELGFGALWLAEAVGRDPFAAAAILLSATERLPLATGIASIYARDPMAMVAAQRTLAEAYPDRFLLGLGVSHHTLVEGVRQHDYSKPYSQMSQYLDRMDQALYLAPAPAHEPGRLLAALGPKMLELSATKANGAHPYLTTPEHTAVAREVIGADALLAPEQMVVLSSDAGEARRIARGALTMYLSLPNYTNNLKRLGFTDEDCANSGSDRLVDALVAWGTAEQIASRVAAHHAAGADHVCVQVLTGDLGAMPADEWRELAPALLG